MISAISKQGVQMHAHHDKLAVDKEAARQSKELRKLEQRQQRVAKKEVRSSPISLGRGNNIH